jgi:hypothetical protein
MKVAKHAVNKTVKAMEKINLGTGHEGPERE